MDKSIFNSKESEKIVNAIRQAETNTSGEIRVHIENHCPDKNVLDRAARVFADLKMHKTELRNGVLIYLAIKDHKFAILGDAGINAVVPPNFWDSLKDEMLALFKQKKYTEGLITGILKAGQQLKAHFPYQEDDINELSDDISFGSN
jgi:uncharacterized membrane protein